MKTGYFTNFCFFCYIFLLHFHESRQLPINAIDGLFWYIFVYLFEHPILLLFVAFFIVLFLFLKCRSRFKSHYMPLLFSCSFMCNRSEWFGIFLHFHWSDLPFLFTVCLFFHLAINTRWSLYDGSQSPWLAFGFSVHAKCQKMSPNLRTHLHVPFVCLSVCFAPSWLAVPSTLLLLSVGVIFNLRNPALVQCAVGTTPQHWTLGSHRQRAIPFLTLGWRVRATLSSQTWPSTRHYVAHRLSFASNQSIELLSCKSRERQVGNFR